MLTPCSVDIVTLGCSKNLVDSERLTHQLEAEGYVVYNDPETLHGDIAIINTCGFIGDAKEESINVILEQVERRKRGELKRLYVMGCLSQRYMTDLQGELPEVDKFYGKFDWDGIIKDLGATVHRDLMCRRTITTPPHYAYLKISEGCNRRCAYCAIPIITGHHVSRPMDEILEEVRFLVSKGVKEVQVIAQELTYYGLDLYGERRISALIDAISKEEGIEWIRLHYAYPTDFPMDLLDVMRDNPKVCKYIDIALQHINDKVLDMMHRHITGAETRTLLNMMREKVPGIHIRTTMMVGHPGETEAAFEELLSFVREMRFERLGAFAYSQEDGTWSGTHYADDIPEETKQARLSKLMRVQQHISAEIQNMKVGSKMRVIVDRREGDYWIGRTEYDSPEVDPEVLIPVAGAPAVEIGNFYDVQITSADDFDLYAIL